MYNKNKRSQGRVIIYGKKDLPKKLKKFLQKKLKNNNNELMQSIRLIIIITVNKSYIKTFNNKSIYNTN